LPGRESGQAHDELAALARPVAMSGDEEVPASVRAAHPAIVASPQGLGMALAIHPHVPAFLVLLYVVLTAQKSVGHNRFH
jgi:hypothetical protein